MLIVDQGKAKMRPHHFERGDAITGPKNVMRYESWEICTWLKGAIARSIAREENIVSGNQRKDKGRRICVALNFITLLEHCPAEH